MDIGTVALFAAALFVAAGSPGPSIAALVARVLAKGWRDIMPFVLAMWVGEVLWLGMAMAGLTTLAQSFYWGFVALKWAGIAYLLWLAWSMWRAPTDASPPAETPSLPSARGAWGLFGAGMAVTLGNPKIMVFYLALLPTLIDVQAVTWHHAVILALVTVVTLAVADFLWIGLAQRARAFLRTPRALRWSNRVSASVMGGAAVAIAAKG